MEPWVIPVIVVVVVIGIVVGLILGPLRRVWIKAGDVETKVDAAGPGTLEATDSTFEESQVKGRGAKVKFEKTKSSKSKFDVR